MCHDAYVAAAATAIRPKPCPTVRVLSAVETRAVTELGQTTPPRWPLLRLAGKKCTHRWKRANRHFNVVERFYEIHILMCSWQTDAAYIAGLNKPQAGNTSQRFSHTAAWWREEDVQPYLQRFLCSPGGF